MIILIITMVVIILFVAFWHFGKKPHKYKMCAQDSLSNFFTGLLYRGLHGGLLFIDLPKREEFIQFVKYIQDGKVRIETGFPLAGWSKQYYYLLRKKLDERGVEYSIVNSEYGKGMKIPEGAVSENIIINFGKDTKKAERFARMVLEEIFKLDPDTRINVYLQNGIAGERTTILGEEDNTNNIDDRKNENNN